MTTNTFDVASNATDQSAEPMDTRAENMTMHNDHVDIIVSQFNDISQKTNEFAIEWKMYPRVVENYKVYHQNLEKIVTKELGRVEHEYNKLGEFNKLEEISQTRCYKAFENLKKVSKRLDSYKKSKELPKHL